MERTKECSKKRIVDSIVKCIHKNDMQYLTKQAYNYLYLCSGFIAHYNRSGFQYHYSIYSLKDAILSNKAMNQWDNFAPHEKDYGYYMDKKDIYNRICDVIDTQVQTSFI